MKKTTLAIGASVLASLTLAGAAWAQHERHVPTNRSEVQAHAAQMFARMDGNSDGRLDAADRAAHQTAMFDRLDTDRNGSLSRAEFEAAHVERRGHRGDSAERHGEDGERGGMRHAGMHRGMMVMRMADANNDGAVTQDEFSTAALAHFDQADANRDGTLSAEERRAARERMREMHGNRGAREGRPAT